MKTEDRKEIKWHILLIILMVFLFFPLFYMVTTSFKTLHQIFQSGLDMIPRPFTLENYEQVFKATLFFRYVANTLLIATIVTVAKMITSILAAYCFVYFNFRFKNALFYIFTATMFVPFTVIMIPNYITIAKIGLLNNPVGVVLPQLADAMGIFLMRQSMRTIPRSLIESARLDGVSHLQTMRLIVLPIIRPAVLAMCIVFFINSWNEYFWPMLILSDKENFTITLSLQMFLNSEGGSAWGSSMALATMAALVPFGLYLISQRFIISTFMQSGIKE